MMMAHSFSRDLVAVVLSLLVNGLIFFGLLILSKPNEYHVSKMCGQPIGLVPYPDARSRSKGVPAPAPEARNIESELTGTPKLEIPAIREASIPEQMHFDSLELEPEIQPEIDLKVLLPETRIEKVQDEKAVTKVAVAKQIQHKPQKRYHNSGPTSVKRRKKTAQNQIVGSAANKTSSVQSGSGANPTMTRKGKGDLQGASGLGGEWGYDQVDVKPVIIYKVKPLYPRLARRRRIMGRVVVKFLVNQSGCVSKAAVIEANPVGVFEKAALKAVSQWRFRPGRQRGRRVSVWMIVPIKFVLEG